MANCNHDCNSCKSTCSKKDFLAPMNAHSHVKNARVCTDGPVYLASEVDI